MSPYRLCWLIPGILNLSTKKICHFTTISEEITLSIQYLTLNKCFHNHASSYTAAVFSQLLPTDSTRKPTVWQDHILRVRKTVREGACVCVFAHVNAFQLVSPFSFWMNSVWDKVRKSMRSQRRYASWWQSSFIVLFEPTGEVIWGSWGHINTQQQKPQAAWHIGAMLAPAKDMTAQARQRGGDTVF